MPPRTRKLKFNKSLLNSILHFFIPCSSGRGVLDDASTRPPSLAIGQSHLVSTINQDKPSPARASFGGQAKPDYGCFASPAGPTLSSNPCNDPRELGAFPLPPSRQAGRLRDLDPESQTLRSRMSVESSRELDEKSPQPRRASVLSRASRCRVDQLNVNVYQGVPNTANPGTAKEAYSREGWKALLGRVAPYALYDSAHKYQSPKCDEGTRVEVIDEMMAWSGDRGSARGLLCITGSADAGKSALQQTVAEELSKKNVPVATFSFCKADLSRNHTSFVIPTIAYQIGLAHSPFVHLVARRVENDPFLFTRSLQAQMSALLIEPMTALRSNDALEHDTLPYTIFLDGLNECADEGRQAELLTAINQYILTQNHPHFRFIISSRIGSAIESTLMAGGDWPSHIYHIHLTMDKAVTDVTRMSWRRLQSGSQGTQKSPRRGSLGAATATVPGPSWRQAAAGVSQRTAIPNRSSNIPPRRSQSVPPALPGAFYVQYPSATQVMTSSSDFVAPPFFRPLVITPDSESEFMRMLPYYRDPDLDDVPDSAATDVRYPPSPTTDDSPARSDSPMTQGGGDFTNAPQTETLNPLVEGLAPDPGSGPERPASTPLLRPKPRRAFPLQSGSPPPFTHGRQPVRAASHTTPEPGMRPCAQATVALSFAPFVDR